MWTTDDQTVAGGYGVIPAVAAGLEELLGRVRACLAGQSPRRHAGAFVVGLLADLPRRNYWTLTAHAGDSSSDGMQHLLAGAVWDEHAVREYVSAEGQGGRPRRP